LQEGERITKFFHQKASRRKRNNSVAKIIDTTGNVTAQDEGIEDILTSYFENISSLEGTQGIEDNTFAV
jgi:hypothetical protein